MFLLPPFLKQFLEKRQRERQPRIYSKDEPLSLRVKKISAPPPLQPQQDKDPYREVWSTLSQREQQVTALVCLGYRSYEIADMLGISYDTVRTHSKHIYAKFGLTRAGLRAALRDWNFRSWLESDDRQM